MKPHRTGIKFNIGLQCLAILVIYALVNYLGFEHYERRDYSRSQKFSLSSQTRTVLKEFKKPLDIIIISSPTFLSPVSQILGDTRSLMNEILFNKRDGLRVEYIDPTRNLSRLQAIQAKYKIANPENLIILECDGRHRLLNIAELGEFDMSPMAQGEQPVLLAFRGEQAITSALMGLLKPGEQCVYFLQGHGEPHPSTNGGLSTFVDYITQQNARVETLSLSSIDQIPGNASALVIVAPKTDLDEREASVLGSWMRSRGKTLVLLDPNAATPRLNTLLAASGIQPMDDRILRLIKLPFAMGILRDVTGEILPNSEITRRLEGMNILFPGTTQSLGFNREFATREKIRIRPLVQASEEFWGETNYAPNQPGGVSYDDKVDNGQPLFIAASADRDGVEDDRVEVQTARLIVVGSSQFALDPAISRQGLDLLIASINSLTERGNLSGITPKTPTRFSLNLTDDQLSRLALVVMLGMPGVAAIAGCIVWLRRRA